MRVPSATARTGEDRGTDCRQSRLRRPARSGLAGWVLAALPLSLATALAARRFPQPQFESGHVLPQVQHPGARSVIWEYTDVAVLAAALGVASWLALKSRSRRGIFLLAVFGVLYFGFWRRGCVCAVGSIQNVAQATVDSTYAVPVPVLAFFLLPLLVALVCGRSFCAGVCPLGAAQDLVLFRPLALPSWLQRGLGFIPHVYLGLAVLLAATGSTYVICRYDPFIAFFRQGGSAPLLILGGIFLLVGLFIGRPYCRFFCPYGVLLNWCSRLSRWHVTVTPDECIQCRLCEEACPFGAIRGPVPASAEARARGVRRLTWLLLLLPVLGFGGWLLGNRTASLLSYAHPSVRMARRIYQEDHGLVTGTTLESQAFRSTRRPASELYAEAAQVQASFGAGSRVLGLVLGVLFGLRLIGLSIYRKRRDYEPDRGECLSCGRCFAYCPREQLRLGALRRDEQ